MSELLFYGASAAKGQYRLDAVEKSLSVGSTQESQACALDNLATTALQRILMLKQNICQIYTSFSKLKSNAGRQVGSSFSL